MRMAIGPIFWIDLVTFSRRARYFFLRAIYAAVLLLVFWSVYVSVTRWRDVSNIQTMAALTSAFFVGFSFVQMIAVLLVGPAMVAGTIATERERRTIEYLFTASLSNTEIILSKLASRIVQMLFFLLTGLPILATAMLLGGIAPEALVVVYVVTFCTLVSVSSIAMALSVWTPKARDAIMRVYLLLLVLLLGPVLLAALAPLDPVFYTTYIAPATNWMFEMHPLGVLGQAGEIASGATPAAAWDLVGKFALGQGVLSLVLVVGSILTLRWAHLRRVGRGNRPPRLQFQLWRPAIGEQPMIWKELFAASAGSRLGWLGRVLVGILIACVLVPAILGFAQAATSPQSWAVRSFVATTVGLSGAVLCGMLLLVALRAAGSITSEKERDSWDSILGTPMSAREIIAAKVLGSLWSVRHMLWPVGIIWALGVMLDGAMIGAAVSMSLAFAVLAVFAAVVGTFFSLGSRTSLRAMGATLGVMLFLGGGYMLCCMPVMIAGSGGGEEIVFAPCIVFLQIMPGVIFIEPNNMDELAAPLVLGGIGYLITDLILFTTLVETFDSRSGRGGWIRDYSHPGAPLPRLGGQVHELVELAKPPRPPETQ